MRVSTQVKEFHPSWNYFRKSKLPFTQVCSAIGCNYWLIQYLKTILSVREVAQTESETNTTELNNTIHYGQLSLFFFIHLPSLFLYKTQIFQSSSSLNIKIIRVQFLQLSNERKILFPEPNRTPQYQSYRHWQSWLHQVGVRHQSQERRTCQSCFALLENDVLFGNWKRVHLQTEKQDARGYGATLRATSSTEEKGRILSHNPKESIYKPIDSCPKV